jgi:hypothetical protein
LTEAVGDLNGTFTIADDIIIAGCGQTDEEAKCDHETVNFLIVNFYTITCNFVTMKCYFFQSDFFLFIIQYNILFFASGIQFTKFRLVIALSLFVGLTTPGDDNVIGDGKRTIQIKRLCGMVQYMAKFLPDLANEMEPIRELTRKEVSWNWSNERERAFQNVKKRLT